MRWLALLLVVGSPAFSFAQKTEEKDTRSGVTGESSVPKSLAVPEKIKHAPTAMPDRVILTWKGDPATTQAVTWRVARTSLNGVAEIALSEEGPGFDNMAKAASKRLDLSKVKRVAASRHELDTETGQADYFTAEFKELKPNTRYVYRVGQTDGKVFVNFTEWFEFRTASDKPAPLKFIYFGDAQNEVKSHWSRVIRGAYSDMPKADFLLHAGDLINRASVDYEWGEWHQAGGWINAQVPSVPTPGNHEYQGPGMSAKEKLGTVLGGVLPGLDSSPKPKATLTKHWRAQFALPENGPKGLEESTFFLDINGVRIISLNSNEMHAEQVPWLEDKLKNNPCAWTVVTFHHPVYSTAAARQKEEQGKAVRALWRPLFDKYGVDLILQGHDHSYGRSGLMKEDNILSGTQVLTGKGTVYCVSVSGPKMYELGVQPWMVERAQNKQLYQLISIEGKKLHYEARTANGVLFDEFELRKRPDTGNTLVERKQLDEERSSVPKEKNPTKQQLIIALIAMVSLTIAFGMWKLIRRGSEATNGHH